MTEFKKKHETLIAVRGKEGRTAGHLAFGSESRSWVFMQNAYVSTCQETLGAIYRKLKELNKE